MRSLYRRVMAAAALIVDSGRAFSDSCIYQGTGYLSNMSDTAQICLPSRLRRMKEHIIYLMD